MILHFQNFAKMSARFGVFGGFADGVYFSFGFGVVTQMVRKMSLAPAQGVISAKFFLAHPGDPKMTQKHDKTQLQIHWKNEAKLHNLDFPGKRNLDFLGKLELILIK